MNFELSGRSRGFLTSRIVTEIAASSALVLAAPGCFNPAVSSRSTLFNGHSIAASERSLVGRVLDPDVTE